MKFSLNTAVAVALTLFTLPGAQASEALAKAKGCVACHQPDRKAVGPTYREVAQKYAGQGDAVAKLANSIVKGTPIPRGAGWQKEGKAALPFMSPNTSVRPDEAQALAQWILGHK